MKKFTRQFSTAMFATAALLSAASASASQERGKSSYAHEAHKNSGSPDRGNSAYAHDTNSSNGSRKSTNPVSVPESGTLTLLTAAATAAGLRTWQARRRSPSV